MKMNNAHNASSVAVNDLIQPATTSIHASQPVFASPLPCQWLQKFFVAYPPMTPADDLATCFSSCAAVILAALALGTRTPAVIADVTSFPEPFVAAVLVEMQRKHLWGLPQVACLASALKSDGRDLEKIHLRLQDVSETFWERVWSEHTQLHLESLRARVLYGGATQRWVDADAAAYFDLREVVG